MSDLLWPLERNRIRRDMKNHTYGWVRTEVDKNTGQLKPRVHQGWDLVAGPLTACYAVADGEIKLAEERGLYGKQMSLAFELRGRPLVAFYAHLSIMSLVRGQTVKRGDLIGYCGNTGNARSMKGEDQHLHFEIRTTLAPGGGLNNRIDPKEIYGAPPMGYFVQETHAFKRRPSAGAKEGGGFGLKIQASQIRRWPSSV